VHGTLFMSDKDIDNVGIIQSVIEVYDSTSRVAKNYFYAFFLKTLYDRLGAGNFPHQCISL
jgi:hypothetical protein